MRKTITVSLPRELKTNLDKLAALRKVSRSAIIQESIKRYVFIEIFNELRRKMVPRAQAMGIYTDEDVFKIVS